MMILKGMMMTTTKMTMTIVMVGSKMTMTMIMMMNLRMSNCRFWMLNR